jgi:RNA polymerase sigma-70 factor, ECF subfamily
MTMLLQKAENLDSAGEAELVARALRRDEAAVRAIVQRHNRRLYRLARSIVRNDAEAEDVLQEAYLRAFANLATFRGESGLGTWLGRVVINEALGRLRRERPTVEWTEQMEGSVQSAASHGEVIPFPGEQIDPERIMAQRQIHSLLERAIDDLPDAFRTVLVARVIEDMSVEETATLLNLQPETVKTRLHRARKLVRAALEQQIGSALTEAFPFQGRRCERMADAVVARLALAK